MKLFDSIQLSGPPRNKFNLSHERKMSLTMGKLTPIFLQEIVPGDKFRVHSEIFLRLSPLYAPIMHRVDVKTEFFFVPTRLIWDEFQSFITGGEDGLAAPVAPYVPYNEALRTYFSIGTLADFFGLPTPLESETVTHTQNISALPFRAYQLIYNEYYRDQNLTPAIVLTKTSGDQTAQADRILTMRNRAWEKDYFTSALPWAQRGGSVDIPFGDASVTYRNQTIIRDSATDAPITLATTGVPFQTDSVGGLDVKTQDAYVDNIESIQAAGTINDLRRSMRLQEWLEKNARGGARYIEQIWSHFKVKSSDARLQRPEFLGGARQPIQISEVLSTFQPVDTEVSLPQGNMSGHGISYGKLNGFKKSFEEHGYVIGLMSVLPRTAYQQGIARMWQRTTKFDYYWPEFANIGEQEIRTTELYHNTFVANVNPVFGYQSRYSEYKYQPSTVHGDFRESLNFWHMGRIFENEPALNTSFVTSDPTDRIFAVQTAGPDTRLLCQVYNKVDALRPMPYYGTPSF